ncbi:MAG: hypothetical protein DRJ42_06515 [Deltaproteobacteria bacterium]|nr:MAG: hypothetical protein DRJ42_06515 [Deltaproteobacteria bacterium]
MVVDAEPQVLGSVSRAVEGLGATVMAIDRPRDALAHPSRFCCGFVLDFDSLQQPGGIELLAQLRSDGALGPALILTGNRCREVASEAATLGASCCEKGSAHYLKALRSLVDTVRHGMTGPGDVLAWLVLTLRLTPTERRTVGVYLEGICTREGVASALNRSENTVKETTSHILAKATAVGLADDTVPALLLDAYRQVAGRMAGGSGM